MVMHNFVLHGHLLALSLVKCAEVSARKSTGKNYSLISNSERLLLRVAERHTHYRKGSLKWGSEGIVKEGVLKWFQKDLYRFFLLQVIFNLLG